MPAYRRGGYGTVTFAGRFASNAALLYSYGSLDGGAGVIWKVRQAYYVAGGDPGASPRHGPAWIRTKDQGIMSPLL